MENGPKIWIDDWVYRYFAPEIESYCDILLKRIMPIFDDPDGEAQTVANCFLDGIPSLEDEDHYSVLEAAYDHAQEHVMQFLEMRSVFLTVGVSGLFHLFERQLYRHINKELKLWLVKPVCDWRDLDAMILEFTMLYGQDKPCSALVDAFRDPDLQELRLVANAVKHGDDGQSYKQLVAKQARVVDHIRLEEDGNVGPYSILKVNVSVQVDDVERFRQAILRFWSLRGTFCANIETFG